MSESETQYLKDLWPVTDDSIRQAFESMMSDGSWGRYHGPHCDRLRSELSAWHTIDHSILCSSGTAAVELALRAIPIAAGDEVVLAAYDFKANFLNVLTLGAVPVLVDVLPDKPVMDPDQLASAFTNRTKAILVSHLHGHLAAIEQICSVAKSHGVAVIEDACQCPGAVINGRRAGTIGDVGVLSFGGSKLLTSGRGGALLTSDASMAQRVKLYTQRGNDAYPLSEMQAAIVLPQLRQLEIRNQLRFSAAERLCREMDASSSLHQTMFPANGSNIPAFYKMAFLLSDDFPVSNREQLCAVARDAGIPLDPAFSALHLIHGRRRFRAIGELRNATKLHDHLTVLHHTALLRSADQLDQMAHRLIEIAAAHRR